MLVVKGGEKSMKKVKYVPGRRRSDNTLNHIATKCGTCDRYVGEIGGSKPKIEYIIHPKPKTEKRISVYSK